VSGVEASDSLRAVLRSLPSHLPTERIDRLWVFPPKELSGRESGLLVLSLFPTAEFPADHRQLLTLRYERERARSRAAPAITLAEQGWAPADRIPRVIRGVLARLEADEDPAEHPVVGSADRWAELLREYGVPIVDLTNGE
jgi:hypothetical protein